MSVTEVSVFVLHPRAARGVASLEGDHSMGRIQTSKGLWVDVYQFTHRHDVTCAAAMNNDGDVRLKNAQVDKVRRGFKATCGLGRGRGN